jgi:hypothetical protein
MPQADGTAGASGYDTPSPSRIIVLSLLVRQHRARLVPDDRRRLWADGAGRACSRPMKVQGLTLALLAGAALWAALIWSMVAMLR